MRWAEYIPANAPNCKDNSNVHQMTSLPDQVFLKLQPENPGLLSLSMLNSISDFPGLANIQTECRRRASSMYEKFVDSLNYVAQNRPLEGMPIEARVMPLHCFFENSENQDLKALVLDINFTDI